MDTKKSVKKQKKEMRNLEIRLASDLQIDSVVDGDGLRTVIWTQGCSHNCEGCHNPGTHDFNGGALVSVDVIKNDLINLKKFKAQEGITLSGGDPFFQCDACTELAKYSKEIGLNVWAYTGFVFEDILKNNKQLELLKHIDVLVDGKFEINKKNLNLPFRGSTNQRIIDVKKSLQQNKVVLVERYASNEKKEIRYERESYMFI